MNAYGEGGVVDVEPSTSSEEVAKLMPGARLVKAFNTIHFRHLGENGRPGAPLEEREVVFLAGDDEEAKRVVSSLIEEIGFAPYDRSPEGSSSRRPQGIARRTTSPSVAASSTVAARTSPSISSTSSRSVSGPRELASTTSCPARANSRAAVPPILPLPSRLGRRELHVVDRRPRRLG
jgi:hypothetical protein